MVWFEKKCRSDQETGQKGEKNSREVFGLTFVTGFRFCNTTLIIFYILHIPNFKNRQKWKNSEYKDSYSSCPIWRKHLQLVAELRKSFHTVQRTCGLPQKSEKEQSIKTHSFIGEHWWAYVNIILLTRYVCSSSSTESLLPYLMIQDFSFVSANRRNAISRYFISQNSSFIKWECDDVDTKLNL